MLPILHLNGYKIANPTVLARIPEEELVALFDGLRLRAAPRHRRLRRRGPGARAPAARRRRSTRRSTRSPASSGAARERIATERPRWPMIVLRTPKGWTGPKEVDGKPVEGTWRAHQVPLAEVRDEPRAPAACSRSGCGATGPRSSSTSDGRLVPELAALAPAGDAADERQPARERRRAAARPRPARLPRLRGRRARARATDRARRRACSAPSCATSSRANPDNFRIFGPDETASNRLGAVFERHRRGPGSARDGADRRGPRAGRPRDGGALRAPLPGLARGVPAHRAPRPLQLLRGVHPHRRLDVQPAREVAEDDARRSRGAGRSRRSTTCSPRTSGGRTTTASRTRTRASSTTS